MVDKRSSGRIVELQKICAEDSERWFPGNIKAKDLKHMILALCGEVGEVANLAKKADRGDMDPFSAEFVHDLALEVGDCFVYLLNIAQLMNVDLEAIFYATRDKNERRWSPEARAAAAGDDRGSLTVVRRDGGGATPDGS
jgi:NTP pyrophosphatase (non-canonical NTP hydrolase)